MKIIFIFSCSGMFRNVPECSGMFRNTNPECARTTITDKSSWEGLVQLNSSPF